jgi:pimeloyl-ACP methyl ester carboxylesterase
MAEQEVKIRLSGTDRHIYGTLRGSYRSPLVILCHGYGGWMHEMLLYNGARYFEKKGFCTLRLSMYGGGENSRTIVESDVLTHASDIDDVVAFARAQGATWVGVAGHSYSGMAIVYSSGQAFDAAALWDPTHTDGYDEPAAKKNLENDFIFVDELQAYMSGIGSGYVYAKTVFDNDYPKSQEMAAQFQIPTVVINASWSKEQQKYGKDYADTIAARTKQVVVPDSTHPFTSDGAAEKLFAETVAFFKSLR